MVGEIDSGTAAGIVRDIAAEITIGASKISYGEPEIAFRHAVEKEWTAFRKANPRARLEVPPDIDGLP